MVINPAVKAVEFAKRGKLVLALELFEADPAFKENAVALSYYALCIAILRGKCDEALIVLRGAVKKDRFQPDIYMNIGRVYVLKERKDFAAKAFVKGLSLDSSHAGLLKEIKKLGIRQQAIIPFLSRKNVLNKALGKIIYELKHGKG
ncbi:MAG: hypothetical protein WA162_05385 [Thermodesulfobacteriota bacterium]